MRMRTRMWLVMALLVVGGGWIGSAAHRAAAQDPAPQDGDTDGTELSALKALVQKLAGQLDRLQERVATLEAEVRDLRAQQLMGGNANGGGTVGPASGPQSFQVDGMVSYVCRVGTVKKGQLIAELDRVDRLLRMAATNEQISSLKTSITITRKWAVEAQGKEMAAHAEAEAAKQEMSRLQPEVAAGRQPQAVYDAAQRRWSAALNDTTRHRVQRQMHERNVEKQQEEIARLQALMEDHREKLPLYRLEAPADGEVTAVHVEVGQNVMAGQAALEFTPAGK